MITERASTTKTPPTIASTNSWCVATEIDFKTTYVCCSRDCALDLLALPGLETYPIDPATGITYLSDTRNPTPDCG